jgi:UDP-N-acetylmuramate--alanine ligase
MSALARLLSARGHAITGSDSTPSRVTAALADSGIPVSFDQSPEDIPEDATSIVCSAAIPGDHPLPVAAMNKGLTVFTYAEALGSLMGSATGIAVAGTHGKSTTVGMLGVMLAHTGLDPSVIVGATCAQLSHEGEPPTGCRVGAETIPSGHYANRPGLLLAEACEYNRSFHALRPTIGAITCVEADHLDIYGSLDAVVEAFHEFAKLLPSADAGGKLIIAHDGAHRREITAGLDAEVQTVGFAPAADWQVTYDTAHRRVGLIHNASPVADWTLTSPGDHMAMNSAFAAVIAINLGAPPELVAQGLSQFTGVDRRLQHVGDKHPPHHPHGAPPVRVYDDYGHHPTEIDETLRALREFEQPEKQGGRLICVFQPHQHSRTRFLLDEFAQSFSRADVVIVPHIYFVRDSEIEKTKVSAADLVDRLRKRSVQAMHLYPFEAIVEQLQNICRPGDLLVVMGAGPVWEIARDFIRAGTPEGGDA